MASPTPTTPAARPRTFGASKSGSLKILTEENDKKDNTVQPVLISEDQLPATTALDRQSSSKSSTKSAPFMPPDSPPGYSILASLSKESIATPGSTRSTPAGAARRGLLVPRSTSPNDTASVKRTREVVERLSSDPAYDPQSPVARAAAARQKRQRAGAPPADVDAVVELESDDIIRGGSTTGAASPAPTSTTGGGVGTRKIAEKNPAAAPGPDSEKEMNKAKKLTKVEQNSGGPSASSTDHTTRAPAPSTSRSPAAAGQEEQLSPLSKAAKGLVQGLLGEEVHMARTAGGAGGGAVLTTSSGVDFADKAINENQSGQTSPTAGKSAIPQLSPNQVVHDAALQVDDLVPPEDAQGAVVVPSFSTTLGSTARSPARGPPSSDFAAREPPVAKVDKGGKKIADNYRQRNENEEEKTLQRILHSAPPVTTYKSSALVQQVEKELDHLRRQTEELNKMEFIRQKAVKAQQDFTVDSLRKQIFQLQFAKDQEYQKLHHKVAYRVINTLLNTAESGLEQLNQGYDGDLLGGGITPSAVGPTRASPINHYFGDTTSTPEILSDRPPAPRTSRSRSPPQDHRLNITRTTSSATRQNNLKADTTQAPVPAAADPSLLVVPGRIVNTNRPSSPSKWQDEVLLSLSSEEYHHGTRTNDNITTQARGTTQGEQRKFVAPRGGPRSTGRQNDKKFEQPTTAERLWLESLRRRENMRAPEVIMPPTDDSRAARVGQLSPRLISRAATRSRSNTVAHQPGVTEIKNRPRPLSSAPRPLSTQHEDAPRRVWPLVPLEIPPTAAATPAAMGLGPPPLRNINKRRSRSLSPRMNNTTQPVFDPVVKPKPLIDVKAEAARMLTPLPPASFSRGFFKSGSKSARSVSAKSSKKTSSAAGKAKSCVGPAAATTTAPQNASKQSVPEELIGTGHVAEWNEKTQAFQFSEVVVSTYPTTTTTSPPVLAPKTDTTTSNVDNSTTTTTAAGKQEIRKPAAGVKKAVSNTTSISRPVVFAPVPRAFSRRSRIMKSPPSSMISRADVKVVPAALLQKEQEIIMKEQTADRDGEELQLLQQGEDFLGEKLVMHDAEQDGGDGPPRSNGATNIFKRTTTSSRHFVSLDTDTAQIEDLDLLDKVHISEHRPSKTLLDRLEITVSKSSGGKIEDNGTSRPTGGNEGKAKRNGITVASSSQTTKKPQNKPEELHQVDAARNMKKLARRIISTTPSPYHSMVVQAHNANQLCYVETLQKLPSGKCLTPAKDKLEQKLLEKKRNEHFPKGRSSFGSLLTFPRWNCPEVDDSLKKLLRSLKTKTAMNQ
ncbi:unnamed protein product [Amoebophrya sp. A120]|nr:unnamed protein product [Amoebophrya sp. A120]|eukprot:GSA120T00013670001.1